MCNRLYKPSLVDVGFYLILSWVPTRCDGKTGDPLMAITDNPVMAGCHLICYYLTLLCINFLQILYSCTKLAAFPSVMDVNLKKTSSDLYSGVGTYYGGYEGSSLHRWYRESSDGTRFCVDGADSSTYEVADADYSCRLLFG